MPIQPSSGLLDQIAINHGTDKSSKQHSYCDLYEQHLPPNPRTILEIGIGQGGSLRMWKEFYAKRGLFPRVIGVDNDPECTYFDLDCLFGDATKPSTFMNLPRQFDVVIDDGSHQALSVISTFSILWPRVAVGGLYVIEDLECTRHVQFGGNNRGGPVVELLNTLVPQAIKGALELHFYKEIAFISR